MLEALLGSRNKERILVFIYCRKTGYARQIAEFYEIPLTVVINHLKNLEGSNVLFTEIQGRTKLYRFNPRYPFLKELYSLLEKALSFYPENLVQKLQYNRRRPRKTGKPL